MIDFLRELLRETLRSPRAAARRLLDQGYADSAAWTAFGIVVAGGALLVWLAVAMAPAPETAAPAASTVSGFALAFLQAGKLLLLAGLATLGGRAFGGRGRFQEVLLLVVWLEFILLLLQLLQLIVMILFPFSSVLIVLAGLVLFLWLLTNFVAEAHGFASLGKVFFGIIAGFLLAGMLLAPLLGPFMAQQGG